jgi:uncharacterized protein YuzE
MFNYDSKNDIMYITFKDDKCTAEEPYEGFVVRINENDEVCGFTILDWMKQDKVKLFNNIINYYKEQINLYENIIQKLEQIKNKGVII